MGSKYKVVYYCSPSGDKPFSKFLDSLNKKAQVKIIRDFYHITEFGLDAIKRHVKKLTGTPLWEIRILGRDNIRIIYCFSYKDKAPSSLRSRFSAKEDKILVLHGFVKKRQKTPPKEIETAMERYRDWLKRSR